VCALFPLHGIRVRLGPQSLGAREYLGTAAGNDGSRDRQRSTLKEPKGFRISWSRGSFDFFVLKARLVILTQIGAHLQRSVVFFFTTNFLS
jgi:hypothetical protein